MVEFGYRTLNPLNCQMFQNSDYDSIGHVSIEISVDINIIAHRNIHHLGS